MTDTDRGKSRRTPTSADVARLAGVSRATVSFVLNDAPQSIPESTREAVWRAARMLSYRPNLAAKALAEGASRLVLLEVPASPSGSPIYESVAALSEALAGFGLVAAAHLDTSTRHALVTTALRLQPRYVMLTRPLEPGDAARLEQAGIDAVVPAPGGFSVVESLGAQLRIQHLHERGHRRIAVVELSNPGLEEQVALRRNSLLAAAEALGLPRPATIALPAVRADAVEAVRNLVSTGITAVAAYNDDAALAVLRAIADAGLRCPEDLAVIGSDGVFAGEVAFPPLSTVVGDSQRIAAAMTPSLLSSLGLLEEPPAPDVTDAVRLVIRSST